MKSKYARMVIEYFNESAKVYDIRHSQYDTIFGYIEKMRRKSVMPMVLESNGYRILDVGCGTGYYLEVLSRKNEIFGIDIAIEMIKHCKNKNLQNVMIGSFNSLPFKSKIFDLVICINAFHYTSSPKEALNEMNYVLKEDGSIILTVLNWMSPRGIFHLIRRYLKGKENLERRYTILNLQKMFQEAELEIVEINGFNFILATSDFKKRSKKFLDLFEYLEDKIGKTPIKYLSNEFVIRLKKSDKNENTLKHRSPCTCSFI